MTIYILSGINNYLMHMSKTYKMINKNMKYEIP